MGFLRRINIYFYAGFVMFVAVFLIGMSTERIPGINHLDAISTLKTIYGDENLRILVGIFGVFLILINYIMFRMLATNTRKDKIIAFDNPNGRVTVSLFAMEDMIRRM